MEYIEGAPLTEHFNSLKEKKNKFSEERIWNIFVQVGRGKGSMSLLTKNRETNMPWKPTAGHRQGKKISRFNGILCTIHYVLVL